MGKNDFDRAFDFEEEDDFDPKAFLDAEEYDDDIDLSEFSDEELGLSPQSEETVSEDAPEDELDLDGLDLGGLDLDGIDLGDADPQEQEPDDRELDSDFEPDMTFEPDADGNDDFDPDMDLNDFLNLGNRRDAREDPDEDTAYDDPTEDPDFSEHTEKPEDVANLPKAKQPEEIEMDMNTEYPEETQMEDFADGPVDEQEDTPPRKAPPRQRPKKERKPAGPNIFTKFYDLYFAPALTGKLPEEPQDPSSPRRRRRKTKAQIFKEVYLPPIIACVCLILVLTFVIGSVSNLIEEKRINKQNEQSHLDESQSAADLAQAEQQRILDEAAQLAAGYDYDGAISVLESYGDLNNYPNLAAKRSEYSTIKDQLIEHQDPSMIPNLSFHVLMADPARAFADQSLGGKYNRNFVSTSEFSKILDNLYTNGYVLVDFNSFTELNGDVMLPKSIYLPEGKKPVMLTETLVNYPLYMVDSNKDAEPDSGGVGFASKLVLDSSGNIKAQYIDSTGATLIGDYDLVPILESFIAEHPDFSYQGARAILATTGSEGVFGYRINSEYIATKGQTYHDEQVAGAKQITEALRDKGYTIACYTYDNSAYAGYNANQISADLQKWTQQVTSVIGEVDTFVFAQSSNITDYSGNAFNVMYTSGFRYFVSNGSTPSTQVTSTYVRQNRLMVTGNSMAYNSSWFTGMFDCAAILDVNLRGNVPN